MDIKMDNVNDIDSLINNLAGQIDELTIMQTTTTNMHDNFKYKTMIDELDIQRKNILLDKENLENIVDKLYNMDLNETDAVKTYHGINNKFKADTIIPFDAKYLPIEVPNMYCYKYFDDEDYVYFTLRIPEEILANISTIKLETCNNEIDLFEKIALKTRKLIKKNEIYDDCVKDSYSNNSSQYYYKYEFLNNKVYYEIINIYINVLKFYYNINTNNMVRWGIFGNNLNNTLDEIFEQMKTEICFSFLENNYKCLDRLHKELVFGLRLIMNQMDIIRNFYRTHNLAFQNYNVRHQNRFIRLLNNFCVLMIFLKFNNIDLGENVSYDDFVRFNSQTQDETDIMQNNNSIIDLNSNFNGPTSKFYARDLDNNKLSVGELSSARMEDF